MAPLIGEAIRRIHEAESVGALFSSEIQLVQEMLLWDERDEDGAAVARADGAVGSAGRAGLALTPGPPGDRSGQGHDHPADRPDPAARRAGARPGRSRPATIATSCARVAGMPRRCATRRSSRPTRASRSPSSSLLCVLTLVLLVAGYGSGFWSLPASRRAG